MKDFVFLLYPRCRPLYQLFCQNKDCGTYLEAIYYLKSHDFHIEILAKHFWDRLLHHVFPEINWKESGISNTFFKKSNSCKNNK